MTDQAIVRMCGCFCLPPLSEANATALSLWRAVGRMSDCGRPAQQADFHGAAEVARIMVPLTRLGFDAGSPHTSPKESERAPQARPSRIVNCQLCGCGVKVGLQGRQRGEAMLCCPSSFFSGSTPTTSHMQTLRTAVEVVVRTGLLDTPAWSDGDIECRGCICVFYKCIPYLGLLYVYS